MSLFWWGFVIGWAGGSSFLFMTVVLAAFVKLYRSKVIPEPLGACPICGVLSGFHDRAKHMEHEAKLLLKPRSRS